MICRRWQPLYAASLSPDLKQGDVLRGVQFSRASIALQEANPPQATSTAKVEVDFSMNTVVIVSHSCDATPANSGKRNHIVVGPLRPVRPDQRTRLATAGITDLGAINAPATGTTFPINLFHFASNAALGGQDCFLDLSELHSIRPEKLKVENKILELTAEARDQLRVRIGLHFARYD